MNNDADTTCYESYILSFAIADPKMAGDEYSLFSKNKSKVKSLGYAALSSLIKHLDDERNAYVPVEALKTTLGDACYYIITEILFEYPENFDKYIINKSEERIGGDGLKHQRIGYRGYASFEQRKDFQNWIIANRPNSILELQILYIKRLIEIENEIGYQAEEDKALFLDPLQNNLRRLSCE